MRIEQQQMLIRTKRGIITWNDEKYPDMWYLVHDYSYIDISLFRI